jgi:hypothetical protein
MWPSELAIEGEGGLAAKASEELINSY